jgi:hypothetical protein
MHITDWLLVVFTLALVLVAFWQYRLVGRQDEHFTNSERAWILADLEWPKGAGKVLVGESRVLDAIESDTCLNLRLVCRNEGRSPAWIDKISAGVIVVERVVATVSPKESDFQSFGVMEPIGAGQPGAHSLQVHYPGKRRAGEMFDVRVVVEYHDVFNIKRKTTTAYTIGLDNDLYRQEALPERNQNT